MSRSRIQKREALAIARKLKADIDPDGAHQRATVYHEGLLVLTFGINHGGSGHGHLVGRNGDLKMSETKLMALAQCNMSKEQYFAELERIGVI